MKKLLSVFLTLALAVACVWALSTDANAAVVSSGSCGTTLSWTLDNAGTLTISGTGAMSDSDYTAKGIWYNSRDSIKNVVIKSGVTTIGDYAFYYFENLKSVSIPNTVKTIGERAFYGCYDLAAVSIPSSVTMIDEYAFAFCTTITTLSIPNGVMTIGDNAFYDCYDLKTVTIPSSVQSIGSCAFFSCDALTSVTIPANVVSIGDRAFGGCDDLTAIKVNSGNAYYSSDSKGVLFNKNKTLLIQAPGGMTGSYSVPAGVTAIDEYAFSYCYSLGSVKISDSVTLIDDCAFYSCYDMTSVTISSSVKTIGESAFQNCDKLTTVTIPNGVLTIDGYAFYGCDKLTTANISARVTSIDYYAFGNCASLKKINVNSANAYYSSDTNGVLFDKAKTVLVQAPGGMSGKYSIPAGVKSVAKEAFYNCKSLTSVAIPGSVTTIDSYAFTNCESLTYMIIPSGVVSVGNSAFSYCKKLSMLSVPLSVSFIGNYVCEYTALKDVYYVGTAAQWQSIEIGRYNENLNGATIHYSTPCSFPDVKPNAWYYKSVEWAVKKGYFTGNGDGTFGPSNPITRQDFVLVLSRIAGADLSKYNGKTGFADVPSNAYYAKAIHWATENGIISGYNATKFGVGDKLTREQLVTILNRYAVKLGVDVTVTTGWNLMAAYPDATAPNPGMREAVAWALQNGVIGGMQVNGVNSIAPRASATRAQVAQILLNINTKGVIPGI